MKGEGRQLMKFACSSYQVVCVYVALAGMIHQRGKEPVNCSFILSPLLRGTSTKATANLTSHLYSWLPLLVGPLKVPGNSPNRSESLLQLKRFKKVSFKPGARLAWRRVPWNCQTKSPRFSLSSTCFWLASDLSMTCLRFVYDLPQCCLNIASDYSSTTSNLTDSFRSDSIWPDMQLPRTLYICLVHPTFTPYI